MNLVQQRVADLVILEGQIQEALDQLLKEVRDNEEASEAIKRFQTMVNDQRETKQARLEVIGGGEAGFNSSIAPFGMTATLHGKGGTYKVSKALHAISTMFSHAAFGYALLHTAAHLFDEGSQGAGEGNTAEMAEAHRRAYADASQAVYRLIPDLVRRELGKDGECNCSCAACSMGICLCWHAHDDSLMPSSPAEGILMRSPKANSAALEAGLRHGDVILTADDHPLTTYWAILRVIQKHEPGEDVRLLVKRGSGEPLEVTVTLPR